MGSSTYQRRPDRPRGPTVRHGAHVQRDMILEKRVLRIGLCTCFLSALEARKQKLERIDHR